ncbi:caspase, EACC1-associated type [Amycolatopsis minnesotensis]|uniref:Peptidase C14 caspase domain-containing protein n=1 Tax=Amycolatopsis minnesotensis TaxID=337894 RepID=A0ABP5CQP5_9PSEU
MTAPALPIRELSRAVLIGAGAFQHAEPLPPLPAVNRNIADLADALTNAETGVLDPDHCTTVYTPDSPRSLLGQLRPVTRQAEDLLIVYYAGHGLRDLNRDTLYLAVRETDPEELDGTAVPYESVREIVAASSARTKLLILDCCYSGMAIGRMSSAGVESDEVAVRGTSVITSSPRNRKSLSPPGERHTAFTAEVLSLLKNGPRIPGRQLDAAELFRSVTAAMTRRELPEPKMSTVDTASMVVLRRAVSAPAGTAMPVKPEEPLQRKAEGPSVPVQSEAPIQSELPSVSSKLEGASAPPKSDDASAPPRPEGASVPPKTEGASGEVGAEGGQHRRARYVPPVLTWVLWVVFAISAAFGAGGLAGGIFVQTRDLATGAATLVVAAGCGWGIRRRLRQSRDRNSRAASLTESYPALGVVVRRVSTPLLAFIAPLCVAIAITAVVTPVSSTGQLSSVTLTVDVIVMMLEIAAGCAWVLYRRRISGGGSAGR